MLCGATTQPFSDCVCHWMVELRPLALLVEEHQLALECIGEAH
jgi:hypothetical protein